MAIAWTTKAAGNASVAAGTTLALTISPTVGNTLVVVTEILATTSVSSITDNASGGSSTYTKITSQASGTTNTEIWSTAAGGLKTGVTTVTITFGTTGVERTAVCAEYSGVISLGANFVNSGTSSPATVSAVLQGASAFLVAGLGSAALVTYTVTNGTQRSTTQGTTVALALVDNTAASSTSVTDSATQSISGVWDAVAVQLLPTVFGIYDLWDSNQLESVPPSSLGTLALYGETEQFDWGLNIPTTGGGGTQLMGFRGSRAYYPAMSPQDEFGFRSGVVTLPGAALDADFIPNLMSNYFMIDGTSELEAITEDFVHEMVSLDLMQTIPQMYGFVHTEIEQFGFQTQVVVTAITAFDVDQNPLQSTMVTDQAENYQFNYEDSIQDVRDESTIYENPTQQILYLFTSVDDETAQWGFDESKFFSGYEFDYYDNKPQLQSLIPEIEAEQFEWGYEDSVQDVRDEVQYEWLYRDQRVMFQSTDDDSSQSTFFALEEYADFQEQHQAQTLYFQSEDKEEFDWGYEPASAQLPLDESNYENFAQWKIVFGQEDELVQWGFDESKYFSGYESDYYDNRQQLMLQYTVQGEDVFGMNPPFLTTFPSDDSPEQLPLITIGRADNESEQFGFNQPIVTVVTAFDDDQQVFRMGTVVDMVEGTDTEIDQPFSTETDQTPLYQFVSIQELDSDQLTTEGFFADRVPEDFEQQIITNQLALYWTDDDTTHATFFAQEQYGDAPETSISQQVSYYFNAQEDNQDQFGFNVPELIGELLIEEEIQIPNNPYPVVWQTEDEQFGQNPPFLTVTGEVWELYGQMANPLYPVTYQVELDQVYPNAPFLTAIGFDDSPEQYATAWKMADDVETFGFNIPELIGELLLEEEIQLANSPYPIVRWLDDDQFGKQSPFIPSFPDDDAPGQYPNFAYGKDEVDGSMFTVYLVDDGSQDRSIAWSGLQWTDDDKTDYTFFALEQFGEVQEISILQVSYFFDAQDTDQDQFGFNVPEIVGELLLDEELQMGNQPYPNIQSVEDEQFGQNAPFLQTIGLGWEQDDLQQSPPYPVTYQIENEQIGQNPPFLTGIGFDDSVEQYAIGWKGLDQIEEFGFNIPELIGELLIEDEIQFPNQPYFLIQQVEDEQVYPNPPFLTSFPSDDSLEQLLNPPYPITYQLENDQVYPNAPFIISFPSDDSLEQLLNKPYPIVAEDDLVFPPSTILPNMFYDADFNPTMQQSYYFYAEDLEKYNWGFQPPTIKTYQEDALYQDQPQLRSYFVPEIEDEQFSWGFDRSRYYALGDEAPYFTPAQLRSFYIPELDTDFDMSQSTFFAQEQYGDQDEQFLVTVQLARQWLDDDQFGFNVPELIGELLLDEELQMNNPPYPVVWQVEDDQIGQNSPFLTSFPSDDSPEQFPNCVYGKDSADEFTSQSTFFALEEYADIDFQNPLSVVTAMYESDTSNFLIFEVDDGLQDMVPVTPVMDDVEQFGFQTPAVVVNQPWDEEFQKWNIQQLGIEQVEDEQFGFQTQVVVTNQPWDGDFNPPTPLMILTDVVTDFGFDIPFVQEDIVEPTVKISGWQETDSDVVSTTFFASEQYGDAPETPIPQQISYYFNEVDSESDYVQSTFFTTEQFADLDEQSFASPLPVLGHEDDFLYWPPMVADETVDVEGVTFLVQQVDEDFVMTTLVLQPWAEDQIIPIPQQLMSYLKDLGTDSDYQLAKLVRIPILLVYAVGIKAALTLMSLAVTLSKVASPELAVEDVKVTGTLTADFFEVIG